MRLATLFLFLYSLVLTFAPVVRLRGWTGEIRWVHWIGFLAWLVLFSFVHRQTIRWLPDRDPYLLPISALLSGWGLLTIFRLSNSFGLRQMAWLAVSLAALAYAIRRLDLLALLRRYKYLWLISGLLITGLTFILGVYPGGQGPHLWLGCCGVYLMPSEPLKLLLIAYLAAYLAGWLPFNPGLLQLTLPTLSMMGLSLLLLVGQRDLGTASLFIFLYAAVLFLVTNRKRILLISALGLVMGGVLGYVLFDVVRLRIDAWLNPWLDPSGRSYQIVQSLIAVASGGLLGRGPGIGNPGLVPVAHSDFIFSAISEETGLLGATALILVFSLLVLRGFLVALRAAEPYQRYLAAGLTIYLGAQGLLIIGGTLRLFPLTGVTLPFVSYGGSSLLTAFLSLMLLLYISNLADQDPAFLARPRPYYLLAGLLMAGFLSVTLIAGWWTVVNGNTLQARLDNPRRGVDDLYVARGQLVDRYGEVLNGSSGKPGSFTRFTSYPPLSPILGYTHTAYGQAALEQGLDPYLRGLQGNPPSLIWWNQLLYGQPPPGLDVRLSLSLPLQKLADDMLGSLSGAVVMLNARSGEILVMASHPYYDANNLEADWPQLIKDPRTPLLNRATQGQYLPGTILAPFYLAQAYQHDYLPPLPARLDYSLNQIRLDCASPTPDAAAWPDLVSLGCPGASLDLASSLNLKDLNELFVKLGFFTAPSLPLPVAAIGSSAVATDRDKFVLGEGSLNISPLQAALAAAAISTNGQIPPARLATAVQMPHQGWIILPTTAGPSQALPSAQAIQTARALSIQGTTLWQSLGQAVGGENRRYTWYIGGTLPEWQGSPLAVAILLEEANPSLSESIGRALLNAAQNP